MTADKIIWHEVEKGDLPSEKIENKGSVMKQRLNTLKP